MFEHIPGVASVFGIVSVIVAAWAGRQASLTNTWKATAEARGARISDLEGDSSRCSKELADTKTELAQVTEERDLYQRLSNGETYVTAVKSEVESVVESLREDLSELGDKIVHKIDELGGKP